MGIRNFSLLRLCVGWGACICFMASPLLAQAPTGYAYAAGLLGAPTPSVTARMTSLGGAGVALGGVVGASHINPAALGFFPYTVIEVSPELLFMRSQAQVQGNNPQGSFALQPRFHSVSAVIAAPSTGLLRNGSPGYFKGGAFTFSYTRSVRNRDNFLHSAQNTSASLLDYFAEQANGLTPSQLSENWQLAPMQAHHLIREVAPQQYTTILQGKRSNQSERYARRTDHSQYMLGYGFNLGNLVYGGLSVSYGRLREQRFRNYQASYSEILNQVSIGDSLYTSGGSMQASLGFVYRPLSFLQVGISTQSPTYYRLNERSTYGWVTNYDNYEITNDAGETEVLSNLQHESDILRSSYDVLTPWRLHGGATFFISNVALISTQVSWVDYRKTQFLSNDWDTSALNGRLSDLYLSSWSYHLGAEGRPLPYLYFRAGVQLQSPIHTEANWTTQYAVGTAVQIGYVRLGLTYSQAIASSTYAPFQLRSGATTTSQIDSRRSVLLLTTNIQLGKILVFGKRKSKG